MMRRKQPGTVGAALLLCAAGTAAVTPKTTGAKEQALQPEPGLVKVASDLQFPEGPAYDGKGSVFCSNCDADYITEVSADGQVSVAYRANPHGDRPFTFKKTNGMTFSKDGSLFVCDFARNAIVQIHPDG